MVVEGSTGRHSVGFHALNVLLVDDEAIVRNVMEQMLAQMGHNVIATEDGSQAMMRFLEKHDEIDIVIFDMCMPNMDGCELFTNLQHLDPEVNTVLVTGGDQTPVIDEMMQCGLSGVLHKPFSMSSIEQVLNQIIG